MALVEDENAERYERIGNIIIMGVSLMVVALVFVGVVADVGVKKHWFTPLVCDIFANVYNFFFSFVLKKNVITAIFIWEGQQADLFDSDDGICVKLNVTSLIGFSRVILCSI